MSGTTFGSLLGAPPRPVDFYGAPSTVTLDASRWATEVGTGGSGSVFTLPSPVGIKDREYVFYLSGDAAVSTWAQIVTPAGVIGGVAGLASSNTSMFIRRDGLRSVRLLSDGSNWHATDLEYRTHYPTDFYTFPTGRPATSFNAGGGATITAPQNVATMYQPPAIENYVVADGNYTPGITTPAGPTPSGYWTVWANNTVGFNTHIYPDPSNELAHRVSLPGGGVSMTFVWSGGQWVWQERPPTFNAARLTRAQLLALRNAGTLDPAMHYIVTDFAQGRFLAGTELLVHAVSATEISEVVMLNSLFDNEAWFARWDADNNNLIEVRDNRNNVVRSDVNGRVAAWDWGNPVILDNTSDGANIVFTYGSSRSMIRNYFGPSAVVTLTGWAGGQMADSVIRGPLNLTNANVNITQDTIDDPGSSVNMIGHTGGGTLARAAVQAGGVINWSGSTVSHNATNVIVSTGAAFNSVNVVAAAATLNATNVILSTSGVIQRNASVSPLTLTNVQVEGSASEIRHTSGSLTVSATKLVNAGRIFMDVAASPGIGATTIVNTGIGPNAAIQQYGNGATTVSGVTIETGSTVSMQVGSATPSTLQNLHMDSGARITVSAAATAGALNVNQVQMSSGGFIDKLNVGPLSVISSTLSGTGRIVTASGVDRGLTVSTCALTNVGRVQQGAGATGAGVVDTVQFTSVSDYAVINVNANGAAANQVQYSSVRGLTGAVNFVGTNTGTTVTRLTADNGYATFSSNAAPMPTIIDIGVRDQGVLTVQNCTASRDIRYSTVQSYARWTFNACTATGQTFGIDVSAQGSVVHSADCTNLYYCSVRQGAVNHNAVGSTVYIDKSGSGPLTLGAFGHNNIQHHSNAARTLTASNTGRREEVALPLI
ncbi:MAG: hypothetical protein ACRCW4_14155 [Candidatus Neomicrothrix subdominans]